MVSKLIKMKDQLIKAFIKKLSNKLGDINETINVVNRDSYIKEQALGRKVKTHLVQAFNLLVQLEEGMKDNQCSINNHVSNGEEILTTRPIDRHLSNKEIIKRYIPAGSYLGKKDGDTTIVRDGTYKRKFVWKNGIPVIDKADKNYYKWSKEEWFEQVSI